MKKQQKLNEWFSECGIINPKILGDYFIGKHRVLFGYRLRAGKLYAGVVDIDLCCGDSEPAYQGAFRLYKGVMERNLEQKRPIFEGLPPMTEIKPYFKDPKFMKWYAELAEELAEEA